MVPSLQSFQFSTQTGVIKLHLVLYNNIKAESRWRGGRKGASFELPSFNNFMSPAKWILENKEHEGRNIL